MLGDPARRAAYDRALARERQPAARVPAARSGCRYGGWPPGRRDAAGAGAGAAAAGGPGPGGRPAPAPPAGGWDEEDIRLAVLAELALRYLARDRGRPW